MSIIVGLCNFLREGYLAGLRNSGSQQDCTISGGKVGCPPKMRNFQGEATQPAVGPSPSEQPVRGMDQAVADRLPLCKKDTEVCELDEARQVAVKSW